MNEKDKNEQIMGNVDEEMDSEWEDYIGEQLDSEVEVDEDNILNNSLNH